MYKKRGRWWEGGGELTSSSRRRGWGRESRRRSDAQPPEIGHAAAGGGEGVRGGERSGRVTISSPPAGLAAAGAPVATAIPSVAAAAAIAGEERRGANVFWCHFARDAIHGSRVEFLKPGGRGGFGGESGGVQYRAGLTEQVIRLHRD
jgi:hypothetical protein